MQILNVTDGQVSIGTISYLIEKQNKEKIERNTHKI